jgi:hypothetical protein
MFRVSTRTGAWTRESSRHAEHLEVDRTGQRIAVMESPEATSDIGVSILNALGKAGSTFRLPFRCTALSSSCAFFHPDGEQLVIAGRANNRSAIYTVRIADGQVRKVADTPALRGPGYLALSPDGKQLVFTVPGQSVSQIAEVDLPPVTRR